MIHSTSSGYGGVVGLGVNDVGVVACKEDIRDRISASRYLERFADLQRRLRRKRCPKIIVQIPGGLEGGCPAAV